MTISKILKIGVLIFVVGLIIFAFILFATIKTKSTSLNEYEPYKEWIGKTVTLNKETVLFIDKMYNYNNDYPYALMDSLHAQWPYIDERKNLPQSDLEEIIKYPVGTKLTLEKAIQYTNGVSGSSSPVIFGTIIYNEKSYKISYQWGERDVSKAFDKIEKCWQFHQAPWQDKRDTAFYALPIAKLW